jgi:HAMP domain-containing protein
MKATISSRAASVFSVVVILSTIAVSVAITNAGSDLLREAAVKRLAHSAQIAGIRLSAMIEAVRADTDFLIRSLAVDRAARLIQGDRHPQDKADFMESLADVFSAILESRPWYFRVRFVEAGEEGREVVRVERVNDRIRRTPDELLQNQSSRPYFLDMAGLAKGEFFLSRIDLGQEHADVLEPNIPTLRGARPVVSDAGTVVGFVIVNVDMDPVFEAAASLLDPRETLYIANSAGDFVFHIDAGRTFGSQRGKPGLAPQEIPEITSLLDGSVEHLSVERMGNATGKAGIGYLERVSLDPGGGDRFLVLGVSTPDELVLEHVNEIRKRSAVYTFLFALLALVAAFLATRLLTRPLAQLTKATGQLVRGNHKAVLPVEREDEIGELARNFRQLALALNKARHTGDGNKETG